MHTSYPSTGKGVLKCWRQADTLGSLARHPNWHASGRSQGEILSHKTRWTDPKEWHVRLTSSFHMHEHRCAHSTAHTFVPTHINTQTQESSESPQSSDPVDPQHELLFSHFHCLPRSLILFIIHNETQPTRRSTACQALGLSSRVRGQEWFV